MKQMIRKASHLAASAGAATLLLCSQAWAETTETVTEIVTEVTGSDAAAQAVVALDKADTAWVLTSTALVLLMTIPGLALFYAGMVRKKNIIATMMQCFGITAIATVVWGVIGYSLAFTPGNAYIGDLSRLFLNGLSMAEDNLFLGSTTIPESVGMMFQMTFAIITPALIVGAFADRFKFSALLLFITAWLILVYAPIAHWVWAPTGFLAGAGVLDFAGGTVVHINAGIAGLVGCLVVGKRKGYGTDNMSPSNLAYALIGASLLWVGWFGFNAGSALSAGPRAGMAMLATQMATGGAVLAWMFAEWIVRKKPSGLGAASGAVAGLVAITPAAGFVAPMGGLFIGLAAGVICFWASTILKHKLGYDDSLDVWGVHGVGGIVGAILTGVFAVKDIGGVSGMLEGNSGQVLLQAEGVLITLVWGGVVSFILYKVVDALVGLRVTPEEEREGLDISLHGEVIHN
ncbi:MAG: ammonium transporter [Rhodospirillaceae bacterium]|nr:ammonium transporter [Rhodospirillaceae bacterium]